MIRRAFRNLSFQKKCFLACLLASMIPVILLGGFCYRQMRDILIDREKTTLRDTLLREGNSLDEKLNRFVQGAHYICWNNNLNQALGLEFAYVSEMYLFYRDTLDPLLGSVKALNPEISEVTLYTDVSIYPHGTSLRPLEEVVDAPWLNAVLEDHLDHWITDPEQKTLVLASRIYGLPEGKTALVKMDFRYDSAFSAMRTLYENAYGILLTDPQGTVVYEYHTQDMEGKTLSPDRIRGGGGYLEGYVVESVPDIGENWTLWLYRPMDTLLVPVREIGVLIWAIILLCLVFVVCVSFFLSSGIVRPLAALTAQMKQVEKGDLVSHADYESRDEIGALTKAFNQMVERLNRLIDQLIREKVLQKEYEMKALQAQINPHFLYNSLSLINSRAILADQTEISQMARFLSTFYRTTLNKGKSTTCVRDEMENVRSYVSIQLLMHEDAFDVAYEIPEALLDCPMPNLLLQPLVENAIFHGLDCIESGQRGRLRITAWLDENTLVFRISDNGPGIPPEKLHSLLLAGAEDGYGVRNVHQRVQLLCGSEYGLSYESQQGVGTTAVLRLPVKAGREEKGILYPEEN